MADERQETEIKPGDWVECIHEGNYCDQFHGGGLYQVTMISTDGLRVRYHFAKDDRGATNGWTADKFILHVACVSLSQMGYDEYEEILADQDAYEKILMED